MAADDAMATAKGTICAYFDHLKLGRIESGDGHVYTFHRSDWLSPAVEPAIGQSVQFAPRFLNAVKVQIMDGSK